MHLSDINDHQVGNIGYFTMSHHQVIQLGNIQYTYMQSSLGRVYYAHYTLEGIAYSTP